ncbi:MAG: LacI family transcriptional regulator [Chloroflexi bacterium]|nr:LacI family transcriptional regulator [Chloroflexota bacterium]
MSSSLQDIARLAGVSKSTVSRVINNHPNVSARTRQRVQEVIQQENFRPNSAARALVRQQTRVLSVIIPQMLAATFTDPYFPQLIQSISLTASEYDYAIMLWVSSDIEAEERFYDRIVNNGFFDGVLVASSIDDDPILARVVAAGFPHVLIGPPQQHVQHYVDVANSAAACCAVEHLLGLGYQRVATITGAPNLGVAQQRLRGYRMALENAGYAADDRLIAVADFNEVSGYTAMSLLIERGVDAVFAASDVLAMGALRALADAGLHVPDDVALVGFDDMPFAAIATPPLTTVRQPIAQLGAEATRSLIRLVEGVPGTPEPIILPAHLIIRETCGAKRVERS